MKKSEARRAEALKMIEERGWKDSPAFSAICEKYGWKKDFSFFNNNIRIGEKNNKTGYATMFYPQGNPLFSCDIVLIKDVPFEKLPGKQKERVARLMTLSPETDREKDEKEGFGIARIRNGLLGTRLANYIAADSINAEIENDGRCVLSVRTKNNNPLPVVCHVDLVNTLNGKDTGFDVIADKVIREIAKSLFEQFKTNGKKYDKRFSDNVVSAIKQTRPNAKNVKFSVKDSAIVVSCEQPDESRPYIKKTYTKRITKDEIINIVSKSENFEDEITKFIADKYDWAITKRDIEDGLKERIKNEILSAVVQDAEALAPNSGLVLKMLETGESNGFFRSSASDYLKMLRNNALSKDSFRKSISKKMETSVNGDEVCVSCLEIKAVYNGKTDSILLDRSVYAKGLISILSKSKNVFSKINKNLKENIRFFSATVEENGLKITGHKDISNYGTDKALLVLPSCKTLKYNCSNMAEVEDWILAWINQQKDALKERDKKVRSLSGESALYPEIIRVISHCSYGVSISRLTNLLRSPRADTSYMTKKYTPGKFKAFSKEEIEAAVRTLVSVGVLIEKQNYWSKIGGYFSSYEIKDERLASMVRQAAAKEETTKNISSWKAPDWEGSIINFPEKLKSISIEDLKLLFSFPVVCEKYAGVIAANICGREDAKIITAYIELAAKYAGTSQKSSFAALRKAVRKENKKIAAKA